MTDDMRALKVIRPKNNVIWRENNLIVNFQMVIKRNIINILLGRQKK